MSWSPYVDNGGTALAVAGKGYAIICADRRISLGYAIQTRESSKACQLTTKAILASCGMQADRNTLHSVLKAHMQTYQLNHGKEMSVRAISQMLSRTLYYRRFFPYYTFNLLAGLTDDGEGYVYSYDAIGSYEEQRHSCTGSGSLLAMPLLDNRVLKQHDTKEKEKKLLTLEEALSLVKETINGVTERDIHTGDGADIYIITEKGVKYEFFELRKD